MAPSSGRGAPYDLDLHAAAVRLSCIDREFSAVGDFLDNKVPRNSTALGAMYVVDALGPSALPHASSESAPLRMAWFFRVVELDDGRWCCRWGRHVFDTHDELDDAVEHCQAIAADRPPAEVLLHRHGFPVQTVATF